MIIKKFKIQMISSLCVNSTFNSHLFWSAQIKKTTKKISWYFLALSWLYCKHLSCRAISVILGDRWKKMKNEERRMYTLEAKALAEEQKRLNPDCWKRKRTNSVCLCSSLSHSAVTCVQMGGYSVVCSE